MLITKNLDVILHGSSEGMDSVFITKIFEYSKKKGNSVVAFNFPYMDRGESRSSDPELKEEIQSLEQVLNFCKAETYETVRLIGESLGGIVISKYLKTTSNDLSKYSVVIFGYLVGSTDLKNFPNRIVIVQGSKDKFGDIQVVKKDMEKAISKEISFLSLDGADHSYRDTETKEAIYEDKAIEMAFT